jgi:glycyl-tRNA synthetase beta chain
MDTKNLLIELGTEELPPKALDELAAAFCAGVVEGLNKRGIAFDAASAHPLWSPRRLAVRIDAVQVEQPEQTSERRGPAVNAAFDANGQPSKALAGFAASNGCSIEQLQKLETEKGAWFVYRSVKTGAATAALLPSIIDEALKALPIPKPMRWSDLDYQFVRPVHWLIILLGEEVVAGEVLGLTSDRMSRGHRFHHPQPVWIASPETYIDALRAAHVLVDPEERLARIKTEVERVSSSLNGRARLRADLLAEVRNLVEWPVAIACTFERTFLEVPQEALITTMESNQKFFPVFDPNGKLTEHFVGIANIDSKDPAEIRKGYERVIRPRFADAKFFFDEDLKTPLKSHQAALEKVTYQAKLGSVWDKVGRVSLLAQVVARRMQDGGVAIEIPLVERAVKLSKCDLMTRMVGEFPELQGIMGRTYALAQGESIEVSQALDEFYAPRFAGDAIAKNTVAQALAIAEKLDTLAGMYAIGQKPTGNKDPFSLRRNALGLARTLIEGELDLDLVALIEEAIQRARDAIAGQKISGMAPAPFWGRQQIAGVIIELYDFILERLRGYYADQGIRSEVFDAVAVRKPTILLDLNKRVLVGHQFRQRPEAERLARALKRTNIVDQWKANLMKPEGDPKIPQGPKVDIVQIDKSYEDIERLLTLPAEQALCASMKNAEEEVERLADSRDYMALLNRLSELDAPVAQFFDNVMVMVDDQSTRENRLAMLLKLRGLLSKAADLGLIAE